MQAEEGKFLADSNDLDNKTYGIQRELDAKKDELRLEMEEKFDSLIKQLEASESEFFVAYEEILDDEERGVQQELHRTMTYKFDQDD